VTIASVRWCNERDLEVADPDTDPEIIWLDIETTGLKHTDVILEVGIILTDKWGRVIEDSAFSSLVSPSKWSQIDELEPVVAEMHTKSGLLNDLMNMTNRSQHHPLHVATRMVNHLALFDVKRGSLPMAGSTIGFDRGFLKKYMNQLDNHAHYRSIDVSSFKTVAAYLNPNVASHTPGKRDAHRPLEDLADSINLYRYFLDELIMVGVEDGSRD